MLTSKLNTSGAMDNVPQNGGKVKAFNALVNDLENAMSRGGDYSAELTDLATAIAFSVIGKCIDPQRKTAGQLDHTDNSGLNPAMLEVRKDIAADRDLLENTRRLSSIAGEKTYNADGDPIPTPAGKDADNALSHVIGERIGDGQDLVQTAVCAILEQAADHATTPHWLETPYTVKRLARKVYIKATDSAAYRDETTTPIQEVYRAVRRETASSRAVQTDPRNGYTYIEDYTDRDGGDGLEVIYHRMSKYADIGGIDCMGNYTADLETAVTCDTLLERLNLTARQATIVQLRMQGHGYKAIATYLGITNNAVQNQIRRVRERAAAIGLTPQGYDPAADTLNGGTWRPADPAKTGKQNAIESSGHAVVQIDGGGNVIARFPSMGEASRQTGVDRKGIADCTTGKRQTAGGYKWALDK